MTGRKIEHLAGDQKTRRRQHLRDLARLRRVGDRIDREHAQPLDVEARGVRSQEPRGDGGDPAVRGESR